MKTVPFERDLREGILLKRYKRFLADVRLENGEEITVHCPNSGAMTACCESGRPVIVSDSKDPKRKLRYTWELIRMGRSWVSVHSARSNRLVQSWVDAGLLDELQPQGPTRREVPYGSEGRSRVDLVLPQADGRDCYVEIKHSTMRVEEHAAFPDAVTERGRKHLHDLQGVVAAGNRAVMLFVVGRADCDRMRPADEVDPAYGETLREAAKAGVELLAYKAKFSPKGATFVGRVPIDL